MSSDLFEKKIKPILVYIGTIGAVLMSIAYIGIILTMIFGMTVTASYQETLLFALVNAIMGLIIMQFLKIQGISFAKQLERNQEILKRYNDTKTKDKKFRSIRYYWATSIIKDVLGRVLIIIATTLCIIYLVIKGTHDYTYLLLAAVNLFMFACFGLLSLASAYDFFNERHIPYLEEQLNETKAKEAKEREEAFEAEVKRRLAMVKEESNKQRNDMVYDCGRTDFLEPSMDMCPSCAVGESMVLDSGECANSILESSSNTGMVDTNSVNISAKENTRQTEEKQC